MQDDSSRNITICRRIAFGKRSKEMTKTSARSVATWSGPVFALCIASSWIYSVQSSYRFALGHNPYIGLDACDGQLRLTMRYEPKMEFDPGAPIQFTTGSSAGAVRWFAKPFYYHPDSEYSIVTFGIASWLAFSGFLPLWVATLLFARKLRRRRANDGRQGPNNAEQGAAGQPATRPGLK